MKFALLMTLAFNAFSFADLHSDLVAVTSADRETRVAAVKRLREQRSPSDVETILHRLPEVLRNRERVLMRNDALFSIFIKDEKSEWAKLFKSAGKILPGATASTTIAILREADWTGASLIGELAQGFFSLDFETAQRIWKENLERPDRSPRDDRAFLILSSLAPKKFDELTLDLVEQNLKANAIENYDLIFEWVEQRGKRLKAQDQKRLLPYFLKILRSGALPNEDGAFAFSALDLMDAIVRLNNGRKNEIDGVLREYLARLNDTPDSVVVPMVQEMCLSAILELQEASAQKDGRGYETPLGREILAGRRLLEIYRTTKGSPSRWEEHAALVPLLLTLLNRVEQEAFVTLFMNADFNQEEVRAELTVRLYHSNVTSLRTVLYKIKYCRGLVRVLLTGDDLLSN